MFVVAVHATVVMLLCALLDGSNIFGGKLITYNLRQIPRECLSQKANMRFLGPECLFPNIQNTVNAPYLPFDELILRPHNLYSCVFHYYLIYPYISHVDYRRFLFGFFGSAIWP